MAPAGATMNTNYTDQVGFKIITPSATSVNGPTQVTVLLVDQGTKQPAMLTARGTVVPPTVIGVNMGGLVAALKEYQKVNPNVTDSPSQIADDVLAMVKRIYENTDITVQANDPVTTIQWYAFTAQAGFQEPDSLAETTPNENGRVGPIDGIGLTLEDILYNDNGSNGSKNSIGARAYALGEALNQGNSMKLSLESILSEPNPGLLTGDFIGVTLAHELGHSLGLWDAYQKQPDGSIKALFPKDLMSGPFFTGTGMVAFNEPNTTILGYATGNERDPDLDPQTLQQALAVYEAYWAGKPIRPKGADGPPPVSSTAVVRPTGAPQPAANQPPSDILASSVTFNTSPTSTVAVTAATTTAAPQAAPVGMVGATATSTEELTVTYDVANNRKDHEITIRVYRSQDKDYDRDNPIQVKIADVQLTAADSANGHHEIKITTDGPYQFLNNDKQPLRPDPTHEYVIVTLDDDGTLNPHDVYNTPQKELRIWLVAAVTHGFTAGPLNLVSLFLSNGKSAGPSPPPYQDWVDKMAMGLMKDKYDYVYPFHWEDTSNTNYLKPGYMYTEEEGYKLATQLIAKVPGHLDGFNDQSDVVDIQFIGHSRGSVVISQALMDINDSNTEAPQNDLHIQGDDSYRWLTAGFDMMTMLDPHPANNAFGDMDSGTVMLSLPPLINVTIDIGAVAAQTTRAFQASAEDSNVVVPSNVSVAQDYWQHTSANDLSGTERLLNLWGETHDQIENESDVQIQDNEETGSGVGHTEIWKQVYLGIVQKTGIPVYPYPDPTTGQPLLYPVTLFKMGLLPFGADSNFGAGVDPLVVTAQPPATVTAGIPFSLAVAADNPDGSVNKSFQGPISLTLQGGSAGAALDGTLTVNAVNGVASFSGLTLNLPATAYTIAATTSSIPGTATDPISVVAAVPPASAIPLAPPSNLGQAANSLTHSTEHYQDFVTTTAYQTYLGRKPDASGLNAWVSAMQAGMTDEQLEATFISSPEYIANHGGSGAGWVTGMYRDLLGRTPAGAEVNGWVQAMSAGATPRSVALGFAASAEREAARIRQDYQTLLGRTPEAAEVAGWVSAFTGGLTNEGLVAGFLASSEYYNNPAKGNGDNRDWITSATSDVLTRAATTDEMAALEAALMPANLAEMAGQITHSAEHFAQFITTAYQKYLGRTPDDAGLAFWVSLMQAGLSDEQLEAKFIGSPEYIAQHGGNGAGWVRGLYHDLLGRNATDAEVSGWVNALNKGVSTETIAFGFASSPEREAMRIRDDYFSYLGRDASPGEIDFWVKAFGQGLSNEDLAASFIASPEYYDAAAKGRSDKADWLASVISDTLGRNVTAGELRSLGTGLK
jgi:hypothetical protein